MMHAVTAKTLEPTPLRPLVPQADGAEEALAKRAAAGDASAFDALVTLFTSRVFAVACRMLADRAEAEDLAQEVFVALHHALPTFRNDCKLSTWIYRITRNRCLNRMKFLKRRHIGRHTDIDDPTQRATSDPATEVRGARDADTRLERMELQALLEQHLMALPEEQRTIVILRDLEDLSYDEIADITGLPLGTVKSRLHRARLELSARIGPHLDAIIN